MRLVTSYVDPDLDGVACVVGLAELLRANGEVCLAGIFGAPQQEAAWVLQTFGIPEPGDATPLVAKATEAVLVDVSSVHDVQTVLPLRLVTELVDHHPVSCEAELPSLTSVQNEPVGSCATLIAERMRARAHTPSQNAARLLFGAIASNTVNFRSAVTTDRDRAMAAWLAPVADLPTNFVERMFLAKSDLAGSKLSTVLESDAATKVFGKVTLVLFQLEIVGVEQLLRDRRDEVIEVMRRVATDAGATHVLLNALDILAGTTTVFAPDAASAALVEAALGRPMTDGLSMVDGLILRKQIVPKFKALLEPMA